jgi:hypothetical protein
VEIPPTAFSICALSPWSGAIACFERLVRFTSASGGQFRKLNRRNSPLGRLLVSLDLSSDKISRTAGCLSFVHRTDILFVLRSLNQRRTPLERAFCLFRLTHASHFRFQRTAH